MKLVKVRWLDAWFDFDGSPGEWRAQYPVVTVGWLVRDGDVLSLAQEMLPPGEGFRAVTHIPRASALEVVELREGA